MIATRARLYVWLIMALAIRLLWPDPQAHAATLPVTPATFGAFYAKAQPFDVLQAAPGQYPDTTLRKPHITLVGPPEAVFRSLTILSDQVTARGVSVVLTPNAQTVASTAAVRVSGASGVTLDHLTIRCGLSVVGVAPDSDPSLPRPGDNVLGLPTGRGVAIDRSPSTVVTFADIGQCHRGVVVSNSDAVRLDHNHIHDLRNTFIDGGNDPGATVTFNLLETAKPYAKGGDGDHADYIHIWTQPANQTGPTDGVRIEDNVMLQGAGACIMGIYLDDNRNGLGFTHASVARNVLYGCHGQGILLERTAGAVNDNVLLEASGDPRHDAPSMKAGAGSAVTFSRNIAHDIAGTLKAQPAANGNLVVPAAVQPPWVVDLARRLVQARGTNP